MPRVEQPRYVAPASDAQYHGLFRKQSALLFALGTLIQVLSYHSMEPVIVAIALFVLGAMLLKIPTVGGRYEYVAFRTFFSVCWLWAGVAAVFANQFDDASQNHFDPIGFFILAAGDAAGAALSEIRALTVGSGAVVLWRMVYDVFHSLGLAKERFIGIGVNVWMLSMTAVIGIKMVRIVFGEDDARLRRFIIAFSLSGVLWLCGSIHVRDAAVIATVTLLTWVWLRFVAKPSALSLFWLCVATFASIEAFTSLRRELVLIPVAMLIAVPGAYAFGNSSRPGLRALGLIAVVLSLPFVILLAWQFQSSVFETLLVNRLQYFEYAAATHDADSLGMRYIVNAPLPLRMTLGSLYLFIFPIPVWSGVEQGTVYGLLNTLQALFMYALTPLVALSAWRIARREPDRGPAILFLCFVSAALVGSIAMTSLEIRHFAMVVPTLIVVAVLPDLRERKELRAYRRLAAWCLGSMFLVHFAWAVMKFV